MENKLLSWGGYPHSPQISHPCFWRHELAANLTALANEFESTLAYGNGRSYGDSCLAESGHVLTMRSLDRFLSADWEKGIVIAEAGVTLAELLAIAIPKGWFLPVTPGTKFVTLGGAIANDVHGKNHHVRGTFGCHVLSFGLLRSDREAIVCSPSEQHADLYSATIGGLGLTGLIAWVELKMMPIRSSNIEQTQVRFNSLSEFFALSNEFDKASEYTVSWIDCLASGKSTGRGVFMAGSHAASEHLEVDHGRNLRMPFTPPVSAVNKLTLKAFNTVYYRMHKKGKRHSIVGYEPFFYPLDRILYWNRIYGVNGFQQYQCVIPSASAEVAVAELLKVIASAGSGSFLAVLKRCGDVVSPGFMSFPMPGVTLALDFSQQAALNKDIFPRMDTIVRQAGGRLYPAKDAHMSGEDFRASYPEWQRLEALRDPALNSQFWNRVTH